MKISVIGCGNHKEKIGGFAVQCFIINTIRYGNSRKPRLFYCVRFGVRNGNTVTDRSAALRLSCKDALAIFFFVGKVSCTFMKVDQSVDRLRFVLWLCTENNTVCG